MKLDLETAVDTLVQEISNDSNIELALHMNKRALTAFKELRTALMQTRETNTKNGIEFNKGYQDAYKRKGYRPTTVAYVDGYEKGLAFRRLVDPDPVNPDDYDNENYK